MHWVIILWVAGCPDPAVTPSVWATPFATEEQCRRNAEAVMKMGQVPAHPENSVKAKCEPIKDTPY
jgi:hypothetical protein